MDRIALQNNQGDKNLILFCTEDALLEGTKAIVGDFPSLVVLARARDNRATAADARG